MEHDPTGDPTQARETTLLGEPTAGPSSAGPEPDDELPARLGRYVPLSRLGQGGMGVVVEAFDTQLARRVAIKVLHGRRRRPLGINAAPRLRREARALAQLAHPNVVEIYDVGEAEGILFVAMELVEGQTLTAWQRAQPRSWTEIVDAYLQAGEGLAAAHRQGLVHRDFKPDNAIIDARGRVRVLDFGLAIALARPQDEADATVSDDGASIVDRLTLSGAVMGTPAYMAPEQLAGREADARSDQFGFCVALYEALHGARPFRGRCIDGLRSAIAHGEIEPPPPGRAGPPAWLRRLVLRGLRAEPTKRWPEMPGLLRAIARGRDRGRRRRVALLGVAAGLTSVAALVAAQADAADDRCEPVAARIDDAWGPQARARVRHAIERTALPYAAGTWSRVEDGLDRYAARWHQARKEVCEAVRDDALMPAVHQARARCLDDRHAELAMLVQLLGEADASVVARASSAIERLPVIERCTELDDHLEPSRDPERAARIRAMLGRAHAFELAGRYAEGRALAVEAAEQAEALGEPASIAPAQLRAGVLHERSGDYAEAERALSRAAWLGVEAGRDHVAAEAMVQLTGVVGYLQARRDEGLAWGRHARSAIARAGNDPRVRARLWNNLGATHDRAGDLEAAREHYARALDQLASAHDDEARALRASTLNNLGNARGRLHDPDRAQDDLEAAVAQTEALRGPEHPDVAIMLANLANIELERRALADAQHHHRRALVIRERALGTEHPQVASSLLNLGVTLQALDRPDDALPLLERAARLKEASVGPEHYETAIALNNLGETLRELGRPHDALAAHGRAASIWRSTLGADHPLLAFALNNLGLDLIEAGRPAEAVEQLEMALALRERSGAEPALRGISRLGLARAVEALGTDPLRARALGHAAWQDLVDAPPRFTREHAAARDWLDAHARSTAPPATEAEAR